MVAYSGALLCLLYGWVTLDSRWTQNVAKRWPPSAKFHAARGPAASCRLTNGRRGDEAVGGPPQQVASTLRMNMSNVMAVPDLMTAAATDVAAIGSTVNAAHLAAAAPTMAVIPAAADEVSASIAHLFSSHAQGFQALAGQAAVFQDQFVQHLNASARSYTAAEAANVVSLQPLIATAAAAAGAAATLPTQISDMLTSFWNTLIVYLTVLYDIAFLAFSAFYLSLYLAFLTLVLEILSVLSSLSRLFGVFFPFLP